MLKYTLELFGMREDACAGGVVAGMTEGSGVRVADTGADVCTDESCAVPQSVDSAAAAQAAITEAGWTDGLPIYLPTAPAVKRMLAFWGLDAADGIGRLPPGWGDATFGRIAANAVMAGCQPEHLMLVITALEAMKDERFNLHGVQCTTHVVAPLLMVNGPIRSGLGINCGHNCFGQGTVANAVIGRAVRLALVNIGNARPGALDKATFGHPGKYTYLFGENEEASPLPPFHTDRGYSTADDVLTVFPAEAPHNINNHARDPYELLTSIASTMATLGNNNAYMSGECLVVLGIDHARILADAGFKRHSIQEFLHEHARQPIRRLRMGGMYGHEVARNLWPRWVNRANDEDRVPLVRQASDIHVAVAGGAGPHSLFIPGWGTRAVSRLVPHRAR